MGNWVVQSVLGRHVPLNNATEFGTNWYVTFRLKYTPTIFDTFVEPPKMAWDEIIFYNDYEKKECWSFSGNLYIRKPDSPTMEVWAQRYFRAYLHAHNTPYTSLGRREKGHSKLFDNNGTPVSPKKLGTHEDISDQNAAVQEYLRKNGGILEILVHDVPNIIKPTPSTKNKNVERVLVFNCGVDGSAVRARGWQYIKLDSSLPPSFWTYKFETAGNAPGVKTTGLKNVKCPVPQSDLLPTGGIW